MRHVALAVSLLFVAFAAPAATFDLPTDQALLDRAGLVVVATVLGSESRLAPDGMVLTDYRLRVDDVLKGSAPATIVVSEAGGVYLGRGVEIAGSARYETGSRVLSYLRPRPDGTWYTAFMALGQYRFTQRGGQQILVRDAVGIETTTGQPADARPAKEFLDSIRRGTPANTQRLSFENLDGSHSDLKDDRRVATNAAASAYVFSQVGATPKRWKGCESGCNISFTINQVHPVFNTTAGLDAAFDAWTNHANSFVNLFAASVGNDTGRTNDDENDIVLDWDGSDPHSSCEAAKGCGIIYFNGGPDSHTFRGESFFDVIAADVLVSDSVVNQTAFESILTHELGHALAFRHSNEGTPSGGGIMNSTVPTNLGANLDAWTEEALTAVYGPGLPCVPITVTSTSGGGSVAFGTTRQLAVSVTGDSPRTYQWYEGTSGDTTTPVGTNSSNFTTPAIIETRSYWVRVSNSCTTPGTNSPTITVTPQTCDAPEITIQPASQGVTSGSTVTFNVAVNGTGPFTYLWYRSASVGDTSVLVGTNSSSFTTPPLTTTTSYWVRVLNSCGQDDSVLATATVTSQCVPPAIGSQSVNVSVAVGEGATIGVNANGTGPFSYQWYAGESPDVSQPLAGQTNSTFAAGPFTTPGVNKYWARVTGSCGTVNSVTVTITVGCGQPDRPMISAPGLTHSALGYNVSWTGDLAVASIFELQQSTTSEFNVNVDTYNVTNALVQGFPPHNEVTGPTALFYRVRAQSACGTFSDWSEPTTTIIIPPQPETSSSFNIVLPAGTTESVTQNFLVPGFGEAATSQDTFAIAIDVPWLTVFPPSGALSAGGTTVQFTINPAGVDVGTTSATVNVTRTNGAAGSGGIATHGGSTSTTTVPWGVSMVTPVSPDPRDGNPPPGTLIIPAVSHTQGLNSPFRSDVRIVNVSFEDIEYEISYTPTGANGTQVGERTTLTIGAGDTLAFDDILYSWFGEGIFVGAEGSLEIRPLNAASPFSTFASSRTYALDGTTGGTLGQFIPALRLDAFVGNIATDALGRISLQQVANSSSYRTNIGFAEGTGSPVTILAKLLDGNNNVLAQNTVNLAAFGQTQTSLTNLFGNIDLSDGRVEVEVTGGDGKATAYASVLNNDTDDPLLVFPSQPARFTASRYVVAGIAELASSFSNFHSDMRLYNGGTEVVTATLNYFSRGQSVPLEGTAPVQMTLNPGQVVPVNDVLPSLWPGVTGGGSVVVTTDVPSSLVVTAQTYSREEDGGTKGQFIPGVTQRESVGLGERGLQVLQLEQSDLYRSNVGFVEVTGEPVTIEIGMFEPATKSSAFTSYLLQANEYIQFDRILENRGQLGTVYNGRVSVRVIGGSGRVYAYGSIIDNRTEDPTYVPAQ